MLTDYQLLFNRMVDCLLTDYQLLFNRMDDCLLTDYQFNHMVDCLLTDYQLLFNRMVDCLLTDYQLLFNWYHAELSPEVLAGTEFPGSKENSLFVVVVIPTSDMNSP